MEDANAEGMLLYYAVRNGDISEVASRIKQNDDVNKTDQSGATPLHVAAEMGHTAIATLLLRLGADICKKDDNGRTAIHNAAMNGHTMTLEDMLKGASLNIINEGDNVGMTALHWTAENNHVNALQVLCAKGADVNKVTKLGKTSLHWAAEKGNIEGIGILVRHGANINAMECDDRTPLHLAVMTHHSNAVLALIKEGADVSQGNKSGDTSLHIAASMNDIEVMKILINCGANVNIENKLNKRTPLIFAAMKSHNESITYLIEKGADVMLKDKSGKLPLHWVAEKNNVAILESLLDNRGDVNATEWGGNTPLHLAALNGCTDAVRILLKKGDNVNKTNESEHRTPLHAAAENGHVDVMDILLLAGAIVNSADKNLTTSLHLASENGNIQSVKLLLQHNATVNAIEKTGDTPLHLAARKGHIAAVQQLLSSGCVDTFINNSHGHTPLMEAKRSNRNSEIMVMLISSYNDFPVHLFKKVVITGSSGVGKSTLAQVISNSSKKTTQRTQGLLPQSTESTRGIVPHVIDGINMVLFDTSGHQKYYLSQYAYLKSILSDTPAVFLVVYNSRSSTEEIQMQLYHWLQMIAAVCHRCPQKSSLILVGTHAKGIKKKELQKALSAITAQIISSEWNIVFEGSVYIDLPSQNLQEMFDLLYKSADAIAKVLSPLVCDCHLLYTIIKDKLCGDSASLAELLEILQSGPQSSIFEETSEVAKHLSVLAERGFIIFVNKEFKHHGESCVVFNTGTVKLLSSVIDTVFGSEISNSNGIIAVSALEKLLTNLGITISTIVQFLIDLELCLQIDKIYEDTNLFPKELLFTPSVLFPGLISSSICRPDAIEFATHYFGLLICPDNDDSAFPPYFLQFLMVKLLTTFCIQKTSGYNALNTSCKVWNQGIHWNTQDGASITVEVRDQFRSLYLIMTLPNNSQYKKQVSFLQIVKQVLHDTCPYLSIMEHVVDPHQARIVFTRGLSPHLLLQVKLPLLIEAISNDKLTVPAVCTGNNEVKLCDWTSMEPNLVKFTQAYTLSSGLHL